MDSFNKHVQLSSDNEVNNYGINALSSTNSLFSVISLSRSTANISVDDDEQNTTAMGLIQQQQQSNSRQNLSVGTRKLGRIDKRKENGLLRHVGSSGSLSSNGSTSSGTKSASTDDSTRLELEMASLESFIAAHQSNGNTATTTANKLLISSRESHSARYREHMGPVSADSSLLYEEVIGGVTRRAMTTTTVESPSTILLSTTQGKRVPPRVQVCHGKPHQEEMSDDDDMDEDDDDGADSDSTHLESLTPLSDDDVDSVPQILSATAQNGGYTPPLQTYDLVNRDLRQYVVESNMGDPSTGAELDTTILVQQQEESITEELSESSTPDRVITPPQSLGHIPMPPPLPHENAFFQNNPIPLNREVSQRKRHKLPSDVRKLHLIYTNPTRYVLPKQKIKKLVSAALSQPKGLSRRNSVATMGNAHCSMASNGGNSQSSSSSSRANSVSSRTNRSGSASSGDGKSQGSGSSNGSSGSGGNKTFQSDKNPLKFNSAFESGNLYRAFAYPAFDSSNYILLLRSDPGMFNTLWFYFSVSGDIDMDKEYTFNIVNIVNRAKNWKQGQLPLVFAKEKPSSSSSSNNVAPPTLKEVDQWQRCSTYCRYFKTRNAAISDLAKKQLPVTKRQKNRRLNTLTFKIRFGDIEVRNKRKQHVYFFSLGLPFTYTDLLKHIKSLKRRVSIPRSPSMYASNIIFHAESLCKTIMNYDCPILTITNKVNRPPKGAPLDVDDLLRKRKKRGVIISCRLHPGESSGSHVCRAFIDFLLSPESEIANELRNQFVFKITPMMNPDGVINGNNRTAPTRDDYEISDRGVNLNSVWHKIDENLHPTLFKMKQMIRNFSEERNCCLYMDIHGHYSNLGHFVFGYAKKRDEKNTDSLSYRFPRAIMDVCSSRKNGQKIFEFDEDFIYNPDHYASDGVSPVEVLRSCEVATCYTLECGMVGNELFHYSRKDYELFGRCVAEAILECFNHNKKLAEEFGL